MEKSELFRRYAFSVMKNLVLVFPGRPIEVDKVGWWRKSLSVIFSRFQGVVVDVKYEENSTDGCEGGRRGGEVIGGRERVREIFFVTGRSTSSPAGTWKCSFSDCTKGQFRRFKAGVERG